MFSLSQNIKKEKVFTEKLIDLHDVIIRKIIVYIDTVPNASTGARTTNACKHNFRTTPNESFIRC